MTSTPWVPKDVTSLPKILAGPIVRKVTENEVSVWLVLKSGEDLTLKIYDSSGQLVNAVTQTPTQLGDKIFIACLRATNPSSFLSHGQSYGYNIVNSLGEDFFTPDFADETGINALIYASSPTFGSLGKLPSFVLPETNLNKLRIIHGSCRKPHGEGIDGLSTLSHMIEDSFLNPTNDRPQMLCLTGDQIYSDDVADALLFMIRKYCPILFNWNETLPLIDDLDDLKPGYRYDHVIDIMNFPTTKEYCKSHLMGIQEFILMYVMAWSPSLWREDPTIAPVASAAFPPFDQVLPNESSTESNYDFTGLLMLKGPNVAESTVFSVFKNEIERITSFRDTLPMVRRALANIPTYMIFDDHEITDDWFLNYKWTENALSSGGLQRRVIQNGMAAYAICQGWGNTPEQFSTGQPGKLLLDKLKQIAVNHNSVSSSIWAVDIANIVLPYLDNITLSLKHHTSGALKYNWVYRGSNFEMIAIDTRTQRKYIDQTLKEGYSRLLSNQAVNDQVKNIGGDKKDLTILLSGTPLYGSGAVEGSISAVRWTGAKTSPELDLESWNISEAARHTLISALATRAKPPLNSGDPTQHRVIVLSGDVHYGFTNRIKYEATNTYKFSLSNIEMIIVQNCSSSLKNQLSPAGWLDKAARLTTVGWHKHDPNDNFLFESFDNFTHIGYNNDSGSSVIKIKVSQTLLGPKITTQKVYDKPFIVSTTDYIEQTVDALTGALTLSASTVVPVTTPDWKIEQTSVKASDLVNLNLQYAPLDPNDYFALSSKHQDNYYGGGKGGRYIVGYNQIGDVSVRWNDPLDHPNLRLLDARMWWRNRKQNQNTLLDAYPLSIYVVSLDF